MCSILVDDASSREPLRDELAKHGIETRPLFYPVHTMPMYSKNFQKHPVAESLGWRGINLPSYPDLTKDQVLEICHIINQFNF
jgi:perosamine synthetase